MECWKTGVDSGGGNSDSEGIVRREEDEANGSGGDGCDSEEIVSA